LANISQVRGLEGSSGIREALVKQWIDSSVECADADMSAFLAAFVDLTNKGWRGSLNLDYWLASLHLFHLQNSV